METGPFGCKKAGTEKSTGSVNAPCASPYVYTACVLCKSIVLLLLSPSKREPCGEGKTKETVKQFPNGTLLQESIMV